MPPARSFVAEVLRAGARAGGVRKGRSPGAKGPAGGRGGAAGLTSGLGSAGRRVAVKARVVRHRGRAFVAAPLRTHINYLRRDGVDRAGRPGQMFDAGADEADGQAFAERCADDRHHFRFMVSPEDGTELASLRSFTRDLMRQAEADLGTRLDWIAVDHWNTDNPHVHVLVRGVAQDGTDLVISRDYIGRGLRARAEALVGVELGPRSEAEIRNALARETGAERWTAIDRTLRQQAGDDGLVDLRPDPLAPSAPDRLLLVGRVQVLQRFGLARPEGPGVYRLDPDLEGTLRALGERGDIVRRLHRALGEERAAAAQLVTHAGSATPLVGRLAARELDDEVSGSAYVVIDGLDGRAHHVRVRDLEAAGDTPPDGIVEVHHGASGVRILHRSDLDLAGQVTATGATWLDRRLLASGAEPPAYAGFGAEVRAAFDQRIDHLAGQGLATRSGAGVTLHRDLLATLRTRELAAVRERLRAETGLAPLDAAPGSEVSGLFRRRLDLTSGRFAMIDNGLGFQLVPWTQALERHRGREVTGTMTPAGSVDWSPGRRRGLSL